MESIAFIFYFLRGTMKVFRNIFITVLTLVLSAAPSAFANSGGISGYNFIGCTCHSGDASPSVSINVTSSSGSFSVQPGEVLNLKAVVAHSVNNLFGVDIAVRASATGGAIQGTLAPAASETGLSLLLKELTHKQPKQGTNKEVMFEFTWKAPTTPGTYYLHMAAIAVNGNGLESGDSWNKIEPIAIVVAPNGVDDPTTVNAPVLEAFPNPSQSGVTLKFALESAAQCEVTIADMNGRAMFTMTKHNRDAGEQTIPWDGRDAVGNLVADGQYIAVVRSGNKVSHIPVSIVR